MPWFQFDKICGNSLLEIALSFLTIFGSKKSRNFEEWLENIVLLFAMQTSYLLWLIIIIIMNKLYAIIFASCVKSLCSRKWQVATRHKFSKLPRTADTYVCSRCIAPTFSPKWAKIIQYFKEPDAVQTATFTPVLLKKHCLYLYTWDCKNWTLVMQ